MAERAVHLPLPIQVVIDDVGWWSGRDGHEQGEPYRTGIARDHTPADYAAIASLGRQLGMRPQAAMVLCEWDRTDRLRGLPSATWQGADWRNRWVGPWLDEAAAVIGQNADHFEPILHGVGHEWWDGQGMSRAEWFGPDGLRPADAVRAHLDAFWAIWAENGLGAPPTAFVPCAFRYTLDGGLAPILAEYGITSTSTPFGGMVRQREPETPWCAVEAGRLVVDRGRDLLPWHALGQPPVGEIVGPVCGMHWPAVLHLDPARNEEAVAAWVAHLAPYDQRPDRMLAPDTARWLSQLVCHAAAVVQSSPSGAVIDLSGIRCLGLTDPPTWLRVKLAGPEPVAVGGAELLATGVTAGWRWVDLALDPASPSVRLSDPATDHTDCTEIG